MDQVRIGQFIARLRKERELTQEELGEKLGVSNKTVSRWENGNYMPDIETLQLLSKEFSVGINELLAGERLPEEAFRAAAEENVVAVAKSSAFSFEEKKAYYKKKWRREHVVLFILFGLICAAGYVLPFVLKKPLLIALWPPVCLFGLGWLRNRMMIYVEHKLYD